ncbi:MAG: ABC transporter ATP-binding protein [Proteobacteria bacterium]|nr:ABC transporter ATP-binding protein [Pseudomonadota bacterium]
MAYQINDLTFYYGNKKVIDHLSVTLAPGKFYGIIGPNGCGKSTFLDLLVKHLRPDSGTIIYKGKDLSRYSKKELSTQIALVPQNFYINFPFSAKEIVMMGRYPHIPRFAAPSLHDIKIVRDIIEKTGADQVEDRFITELSGGERQRVVFARALAQDTPVLILDEATSSLDINYGINLLNFAAEGVRQAGKTVIAVMQDINLAALFCDYLIFMKEGAIKAHGATDEVLNQNTIRSVFNVDTKVYFEPYADSKQVVFKR